MNRPDSECGAVLGGGRRPRPRIRDPRTARMVRWIPIQEVGIDGGIRIGMHPISRVFIVAYGD